MRKSSSLPTILEIFFCIWACISCGNNKQHDTTNAAEIDSSATFTLEDKLEWTGAKLADTSYSIWGSSPIIGDDGKIHVFCARWPEYAVDPAWRKSSEVAHYIADSATAKFAFSDVAVKGTGIDGDWDKYAPHNPEIKRIGDYYFLVYLANSDYHQPPHPANQKIGLQYSKSLFGPWKKWGKTGLIIEDSKDSTQWTYRTCVGNPTLIDIDGKPVVYFNAGFDKRITGSIGSKYGYATCDSLNGAFTIASTPLTNNESYMEDATSFKLNNKYYLLSNDNFGTVTGVEGGGMLWSSNDWRKFDVKDVKLAFNLIPDYYAAYDSTKVSKNYGDRAKFERPKLLIINDRPAYLFAPSGWNIDGGKHSVCYILKIKQ